MVLHLWWMEVLLTLWKPEPWVFIKSMCSWWISCRSLTRLQQCSGWDLGFHTFLVCLHRAINPLVLATDLSHAVEQWFCLCAVSVNSSCLCLLHCQASCLWGFLPSRYSVCHISETSLVWKSVWSCEFCPGFWFWCGFTQQEWRGS
jgi:hypothetical protein